MTDISRIQETKNLTEIYMEQPKQTLFCQRDGSTNSTEHIRKKKRSGADLDAMLKAVKLPASIPDLDPGLADVNRDALPHSSASSPSFTKQANTSESSKSPGAIGSLSRLETCATTSEPERQRRETTMGRVRWRYFMGEDD